MTAEDSMRINLEWRGTAIYDEGLRLGTPELRGGDAGFPKIVGYAAVFNQPSELLFLGVRERIRPGAFKRTLAEGVDVRALIDHDPSKILGRNKAGTLRLEEDSHGLRYEIDPPDTSAGRDVLVSLRRGDLNQSSFGFRVREEEYVKQGEVLMRELVDVDLLDVSIVAYPAYPQTSVEARGRSLAGHRPDAAQRAEIRDFARAKFIARELRVLLGRIRGDNGTLALYWRRSFYSWLDQGERGARTIRKAGMQRSLSSARAEKRLAAAQTSRTRDLSFGTWPDLKKSTVSGWAGRRGASGARQGLDQGGTRPKRGPR